jgi:hypothetical protein
MVIFSQRLQKIDFVLLCIDTCSMSKMQKRRYMLKCGATCFKDRHWTKCTLDRLLYLLQKCPTEETPSWSSEGFLTPNLIQNLQLLLVPYQQRCLIGTSERGQHWSSEYSLRCIEHFSQICIICFNSGYDLGAFQSWFAILVHHLY